MSFHTINYTFGISKMFLFLEPFSNDLNRLFTSLVIFTYFLFGFT